MRWPACPAQRFGDVVTVSDRGGQQIGEEHEVELAALEDSAEAVVVVRCGEPGVAAGVPPRRVRMGDLGRDLKSAQVELTGYGLPQK